MNRKILFFTSVTLILMSAAGAWAAVVNAVRIPDGSVLIDGRLDEPIWKEAGVYCIKESLGGSAPTVETVFHILYDRQNLYLGVVAQQPQMDRIRVEETTRSASVWTDDGIQFFVDPAGCGGPYFQIMANAIGTTWETRYKKSRDSIPGWKMRGLEVKTELGEDRWTMEMSMPFDNFLTRYEDGEPVVTPDSWRFNLARTYSGGGARILSYSALPDLFLTERYAKLVDMHLDYDLYRWRLGPVKLEEVVPEEDGTYRVELSVSISNLSGRYRAFNLGGEVEIAVDRIEPLSIVNLYGADSRQELIRQFSLNVPGSGMFPLEMELVELPSNIKVACRRFELEVDTSPLKMEVLHPFYRSAIYHDMEVDAVRLGLRTLWDVSWQPEDKLRLYIENEGGDIKSNIIIDDSDNFVGDHDILIPDLPEGTYVCGADIFRGGQRLFSAETQLFVYPPSESLVRVNEHRNIVINGRETFLVGMFGSPWNFYPGEKCNMNLMYYLARDLTEDPEERERMEDRADSERWTLVVPYPREVSPVTGMGSPILGLQSLSPDAGQKIAERAGQYRGVRGFLGWYTADEPALTRFLPAYLEEVAEVLQKADPYHPSYISFNNASALRHYSDACDVVGVHWYCMFSDDGPGQPLSTVADNIKLAHQLTDNRKAIINSPLFNMWSASGVVRMPTHDETRCMAYLGIVHGAKGIMWYAAYAFPLGLEPRLGMSVLIDELLALEPVLLSHREADIAVYGDGAGALHVLGRILEGELYIIAVNAEPHAVMAGLRLPEAWSGISDIREIDSDKGPWGVSAGALDLDFDPYEVRIFSTAEEVPDVVSREELKRRFKAERRRILDSGDFCYSGRGAAISASEDFGKYPIVRLLIDGYHDDSRFLRLSKHIARSKNSWVKIDFSKRENIGRINVYSPGNSPFRSYRLELLTENGWEEIEGGITEETIPDNIWVNRNIHVRSHRFPGRVSDALRLTVTEGSPNFVHAEYITGIRAFAPDAR